MKAKTKRSKLLLAALLLAWAILVTIGVLKYSWVVYHEETIETTEITE